MTNKLRLAFSALVATMALSLAVSSAQADRLEISHQDFRVRWSSLEFILDASTMRCPVTLDGSFHSRAINKSGNNLIGAVTRAIVDDLGCAGGGAGTSGTGVTVLTEALPWHVTYQSFAGTLPNISRVRLWLLGAAFQIDPSFPDSMICLSRTTAAEPIVNDLRLAASGQVEIIDMDETAVIDGSDIGPFTGCDDFAVDYRANGNVTAEAQDGGLLFIRLI